MLYCTEVSLPQRAPTPPSHIPSAGCQGGRRWAFIDEIDREGDRGRQTDGAVQSGPWQSWRACGLVRDAAACGQPLLALAPAPGAPACRE
ncbi:hypothetical protein MHYP_G00213390 [Metynnis hypsauchen]